MIELGLQRISRLLSPTHLPWRAVHVAGTNGKGSVCAYVSGMLEAYNQSKYRHLTGQKALKHSRFTSPHLIDRWDCITIDQKPVSFDMFNLYEMALNARNRNEGIKASEFELLTATAFKIFTQSDVDVAVIEVGLGGRLDSTNILGQADGPGTSNKAKKSSYRPPPLVTAITKIGLDHQGFLGDTIEEIAIEKAGIMKPDIPMVVDASNEPSVYTALTEKAGDRLVPSSEQFLPSLLSGKSEAQPNALPHTESNTDVAFRSTWTALQRLGRIPESYNDLKEDEIDSLKQLVTDMLQVPQHTTFPGRLQFLDIEQLTGREQPVLLDGAHNQQSAEVLGQAVNNLRRPSSSQEALPISWVLAASDTKDLAPILKALIHPGDQIFAVEFGPVDGMPWVKPMSADTIIKTTREITPGASESAIQSCGKDIASALQLASDGAAGGPMVIAGSLYLVGDVLRLLRDGPKKKSSWWK